MANVDRKWLPPALIAVAIAASIIVFSTLPPLVDVRFEDLFPLGTLPASPPMLRGIVAFGVPALAILVWTAFRLFRGGAGQTLGRKMFRNAPAAVTTVDQFQRFTNAYESIVLGVVLLLIGLHATLLAAAVHHPLLAARILALSFGASLVVMGNVMPRLRPNWVAGLRTKRTLEDPQLWRSAHRAFGTSLVASGLLTIAVAIVAPRYGFVVALGALIVSCFVGAVASSRRSATTPMAAMLFVGFLFGSSARSLLHEREGGAFSLRSHAVATEHPAVRLARGLSQRQPIPAQRREESRKTIYVAL